MGSKFKVKVKRKPDSAITRLRKIAKTFNAAGAVKVGLPKGSNDYPDGTSVIMVGLVHEFGSPSKGIPERSFLRSTIVEERREYKELFTKLTKALLNGKMSMTKALGIVGLQVQTDVQSKITSLESPALKHREGNPLVDTGHLRRSITYVVNE